MGKENWEEKKKYTLKSNDKLTKLAVFIYKSTLIKE